ncbi:hypothetical protein PAMP_022797 [Pampus punctatissimus]
MLGVSMKHPNILRTLGGFWCDIPAYQLGGRALLITERALYSLQEFISATGEPNKHGSRSTVVLEHSHGVGASRRLIVGTTQGAGKTYCKSTNAENLSGLVSVYNPEKDEVFELNYMTDIVACEDSVPEELAKLTMLGATPVTVIETQYKVHYGIDLLRLAPGRIERYTNGIPRRLSWKNLPLATRARDPSPSADRVWKTAYEPQGTVILQGKKIEGELDTKIAILKGWNANAIIHFKRNVVSLSQTMTQRHPLIFAGPRGELCKCSGGSGVFIFQYGQLLEECKSVTRWNESDLPNSFYLFLLQVFLMLKTALDTMMLPMHMCKWTDILISKGAVMIDAVSYLSKNYMKPQSSLFGDKSESLISLCTTLVAKLLPESELCEWLSKLKPYTTAGHIMTGCIRWLRKFDRSERRIPASLDNNVVTFRDYSANVSKWLTNGDEEEGEEACKRNGANMLVYGHPKFFRGKQTVEKYDNV